MSKHKHADMIKAKADNMELVIFIKYDEGWALSGFEELICLQDRDYFLCLPQHNEHGQCLHWLNGGELEYDYDDHAGWYLFTGDYDRKWSEESIFMQQNIGTRIKPRKEKRWIAILGERVANGMVVTMCTNAYQNKSDAEEYSEHLIEIEVTK